MLTGKDIEGFPIYVSVLDTDRFVEWYCFSNWQNRAEFSAFVMSRAV